MGLKGFFTFSKNRAVVLYTLLFVIILGAIYFFIYIPNNENDLEEQRFNCLKNIELNAQRKVDNSIALLNNLLPKSSFKNQADLEKYYNQHYASINFLVPLVNKSFSKNDDSDILDLNGDEVHIYKQNKQYQVAIKYSMKQFIDQLLPRDIFDAYIVFKGGQVLYQTFPSGITSIAKDSLISNKSVFSGKHIRDITLGGTEYKIFSQQIKLHSDSIVTISGLLSRKSFNHERNKLPENITLLLFTLAIALIFALPWVKLYQMGSQDRLTVADGLFSFAVSMLLMSLLFFVFLKYNQLLRTDNTKLIKEHIANTIETNFTDEIKRAGKHLAALDALKKKHGIKGVTNLAPNHIQATATLTSRDSNLLKSNAFLDINHVFWLDNTGTEKDKWASKTENTPNGRFADRDYFKRILQKSYFPFRIANRPFYLDQVISFTTGQFTSVLSEPATADSTSIAALSFNLKSITTPVLPQGFSFSIVNRHGDVLYHSVASKNLTENLVDEFSQGKQLEASLIAGSSKSFTTRYLGNEFKIFERPMANLPYSVIVFEDTTYKNLIDFNIFSFSFLMLLSFFLILIVELGVVFFAAHKTSFFKKQHFDISWFGPNQFFHHRYNQAALWNLLNIALLIVCFLFVPFLQMLFILLISATSITWFLNYLYLTHYRLNDPEKLKHKQKAIRALKIILLFLNIAAAAVLGWNIITVVVFEIILLILAWWFLKASSKIISALGQIRTGINLWTLSSSLLPKTIANPLKIKLKIPFSWNFSSSFSLMLFTRLILSSGLPVVLFYITAYNYQYRLMSRFRQTSFITDYNHNHVSPGPNLNYNDVYKDGFWINSLQYYRPSRKVHSLPKPCSFSDEERNTLALLKTIGEYTTAEILGINEFSNNSSNGPFFFNNIFQNNRSETIGRLASDKFVKVSSRPIEYNWPELFINRDNSHIGLLYWGMLLTALIIFWQVLHRIIRKLFALNLPSTTGWQAMDREILTNNSLNKLLFIIGSPGSGKLTTLINLIKTKQIKYTKDSGPKANPASNKAIDLIYDENTPSANNVYVADLLLIPDKEEDAKTDKAWLAMQKAALSKKHLFVIVNHFEYDIQNPGTNNIKLNFLESLLQANQSKVAIISTIHPVSFLDSLNQSEKNKPEDTRLPVHDLERWHVLLGHFRIVIEKLDTCQLPPGNTPHWQQTLLEETQSGHFLKNMQFPFIDTLKQLPAEQLNNLDGDSIAFKLQITSHYFYMYIWQSLTKEEKFLLYDLAEDGLVNPYDDYNLTMLISKGLIMNNDGGLKLFNKGFRNFILTAIGSTEALKIRTQIKDNGNWSKLRSPILIFIVAVLVFLFTSQHDSYSTVITYLTVLTAGVPAALKFFSFFENSSGKTG